MIIEIMLWDIDERQYFLFTSKKTDYFTSHDISDLFCFKKEDYNLDSVSTFTESVRFYISIKVKE